MFNTVGIVHVWNKDSVITNTLKAKSKTEDDMGYDILRADSLRG